MNPMMSAIKNRMSKGGGEGLMENDHAPSHDAGNTKDLHGFVESLNDHDKMKLKSILNDSGKTAQAIMTGAPSSEEKEQIAEQSDKDSQRQTLTEMSDVDQMPEDQSDEIGKSMLDSRHLRGMATEKPKNLGDRVKQSIASKLKAKGKI